jgi:hypothetical protein
MGNPLIHAYLNKAYLCDTMAWPTDIAYGGIKGFSTENMIPDYILADCTEERRRRIAK